MSVKPWMQKFPKNYIIIKEIYTGDDGKDLRTHYVYEEHNNCYYCYSEWSKLTYSVNKKYVYTDKEELKFIRWTKRVHSRKPKKRYEYLESTKMLDYRERYIKEYPEKLI